MGSALELIPSSALQADIMVPVQSDQAALRDDWQQVGNDLRYAIGEYRDSAKN